MNLYYERIKIDLFLFQAYFNKTITLIERDELMGLLAQAENDEKVKTLLAGYSNGF